MDLQIEGGHHDSSQTKTFATKEECTQFFKNVKEVFFNISNWEHLFDNATKFSLVDKNGDVTLLPPALGDLIKIKIPGPSNKTGKGYDWVQIVEIKVVDENNVESYLITVSPTHPPGTQTTAHFFQSTAKNYFSIKKYNLEIVAEVHGRNEIVNYRNLPVIDKIRNFFVAKGGVFGLSKIHWELWVQNILDEKYLYKCLKNENKTNQ